MHACVSNGVHVHARERDKARLHGIRLTSRIYSCTQSAQSGWTIECPTCKTYVRLPGDGVTELPRDALLEDRLREYNTHVPVIGATAATASLAARSDAHGLLQSYTVNPSQDVQPTSTVCIAWCILAVMYTCRACMYTRDASTDAVARCPSVATC